MTREGILRFEGTAAWHGPISLYTDDGGHRLLQAARDDRLFPGRFLARPGTETRMHRS